MATRWYLHFLNISSEYSDDLINNMSLLAPFLELDSPPSEEELSQALSKLKKRKAGGKSGILPELILCGQREDGGMLLDQTWKLLVQLIAGMSCVRTGKNGLSFARRGEPDRRLANTASTANNQPQSTGFNCTCGRSFCRQGDLARHKRFCNQAL